MDPRISSDQLSPTVRRLRRAQVVLAVAGMNAFLLALVGGVVESRAIAWIGISAFLFCLGALLVVGILTWGRRD